MPQQKDESLPSLSDMESFDLSSLSKLTIVKAILASDPNEFAIAVGKIEPFVIDEEDEEEFEEYVKKERKKLMEEFGMDEEKVRIALAVKKFKYFIKKMKKSVPLDAVGVI